MEIQEIYNQVDDDFRKIYTTLLGIVLWRLDVFEVGGFVEQLFLSRLYLFLYLGLSQKRKFPLQFLHPFEAQNHPT